ncbi:hypothetical protein T09_9141 [Trichinella sp. T9]|nr:hypothetical protein T09_9141 [Trichinella sp. T9]
MSTPSTCSPSAAGRSPGRCIGMTLNWNRPIGVEKAVFSRSGSATSTSQYPEARPSVLNH